MSGTAIENPRPRPPFWIGLSLPVVIAALYFPLIAMVIYSFLDRGTFSTRWYQDVFIDETLWAALRRSLAVGLLSALLSTLLSLMAAFTLDRTRFRARALLGTLSSISLMLPELVLGLSLLSWFALIKAPLSLWTVIASHVTLTAPFAILVISARLGRIDRTLEDAARDLGASEIEVFRRITLPLLWPAVTSAYLLALMLSFDDFMVTFFTSGAGADLLPVKLYTLMKIGVSPKVLALSSIMFAFSILLVAIVLRRRSIRELARI